MSHTRIKFCGLTRAQDVHSAIELGVDYIGLVFAHHSRRRVTLQQALSLRALVPEEIAVVALLMDNPVDEVRSMVEQLRPELLQFHGSEDEAFCRQFDVPYWKAIAMGGRQPAEVSALLPVFSSASGFLFDGHGAGEAGGSGAVFDWRQMPEASSGTPFLLAGGLSPGNVATAIHVARPWGVDVSSGIESAPGIKDAEKMRGFVEAVRRADVAAG
ncbi:phosphoribosylanthranilate isomerase [Pseudoxanthomonas dokdonensis]|uniref:phosphoribosylanthranilate isomerase n=1 Tax=Pseudoxanthomonas dokdonensis TaxID=344882 RepID=UPI000B04F168|nr:phosphoribosylanthranilate isomerase [Pseudoxanthomonas dokdonensis]